MISLPLSLSQFLTMQFIFGGTRRSCNISYVKSFLILRGVVLTKNDRTKTIDYYRNESNKQVSQITTEQTKAMSCISLCFSPHFNMANKNAIIPASTAAIATLSPSVKLFPFFKPIASTYMLQKFWQLLQNLK